MKVFHKYQLSLNHWISILCILFSTINYAQNNNAIDSLKLRYLNGHFEQQNELKILKELTKILQDPNERIEFAEILIKKATEQNKTDYIKDGYLQKGHSLKEKGDFPEALDTFFILAQMASEEGHQEDVAIANLAIGDVYSILEDFKNASIYYNRATTSFIKLNDTISGTYATHLTNLGDNFLKLNKPDSALVYFEKSEKIFETLNINLGIGYNKGNMGKAYAMLGLTDLAEKSLNEAVVILNKVEDPYGISAYLSDIAHIYLDKNDFQKALNYTNQSLEIAKEYGLKEQIRDDYGMLSKIHEQLGNTEKSLAYFKQYNTYKDSINNISAIQEMANLRTNFEVEQKQAELDILEKESEIQQLTEKKQRNMIYVSSLIAFLILLLALGLYRRSRFIQKTKQIIEEERNRSDNLLKNILPENTAKELKFNGKVTAKKFESTTVMFADFIGFTKYTESLSPEHLVESVGFYFSNFDKIMEKHGLEKIKTIGDAYMCAGGLPIETKDHAHKMVKAAIEMIEFVQEVRKRTNKLKNNLEIRIGINSGPVVAGVVGSKKFAYDIWGDTVNIASRMEACSEPGRINISKNTYLLINNDFKCDYRGEIEVKSKGMMKMYYISQSEYQNFNSNLEQSEFLKYQVN